MHVQIDVHSIGTCVFTCNIIGCIIQLILRDAEENIAFLICVNTALQSAIAQIQLHIVPTTLDMFYASKICIAPTSNACAL